MSCSLFCKLAFLLRQKFGAFGNDVNISVRCLKVLVRAIDVRYILKKINMNFTEKKNCFILVR
jgi:ryanodine receptor 2